MQLGITILLVEAILGLVGFVVFVTLISAYRSVASSIDCTPLNPNFTYSIIETTCYPQININSNNSFVLLQVNNCFDKTGLGILYEEFPIPIPIPNLNESQDNLDRLRISKTCYFNNTDIDCNALKSNTIITKNMTVFYDPPIEFSVERNYNNCLRNIEKYYAEGDNYGVGAGLFGFIWFIGITGLLIFSRYFEWSCKEKKMEMDYEKNLGKNFP